MNKADIIEPMGINRETLNFVYENGIKFVESTRGSVKIIADKTLMLLSYLIIATGFIVTNLVKFLKLDIYDNSDVVLIMVLGALAIYYVGILIWVIYIGKPREVQVGYAQPAQMMNKRMYRQAGEEMFDELHYIKWGRCIEIQQDIEINLEIMRVRHQKFENALACTLILPLITRLFKKTYGLIKSTCSD